MSFKIILQMIGQSFSFKRENMRSFHGRRFLFMLVIFPFFLLTLIVNQVFLILDYILFPYFLLKKIHSPVFIIALPRSATTYMYHALAKDKKYTYFKLWEILFAPSICQKYIFIILGFFDRIIGKPFQRIFTTIENLFSSKFKEIHVIGLNIPEEDEAILLWSLSTYYLNYFFPESTICDKISHFDQKLSPRSKRRIMGAYKRYIQRHLFVFNPSNRKTYLSKNPALMSKIETLSDFFPEAKILNINRCPSSGFPSTLELNRNLYKMSSSRPVPKDLRTKTIHMLIDWCLRAEENLEKYYGRQHLKIDFIELVTQKESEINRIARFLDIKTDVLLAEKKSMNKKHKSSSKYERLNEEQMEMIMERIPFMSTYCKNTA